jgi:hypothetical protein
VGFELDSIATQNGAACTAQSLQKQQGRSQFESSCGDKSKLPLALSALLLQGCCARANCTQHTHSIHCCLTLLTLLSLVLLALLLLLSMHQAHQLLWEGLTKLGLQPFVEKPSDRSAAGAVPAW